MIVQIVTAPVSLPIVACVAPHRRKRLELALKGAAAVTWHDSFADLIVGLAAGHEAVVAIVDAWDAQGRSAGVVASEIARVSSKTSIVLYASPDEVVKGAITSFAITDLIVAGETDSPAMVQGIVLDVAKRRAADRVVAALRPRMSESLGTFAEWAVRYPQYNTVEVLAGQIGIHRQTAAVWCRKDRLLRPEELLMWSRLLLVAAILERTTFSVATLATELDFPSVIALRNQFKRYTGMTPLESRQAGFEAVLRRFDDQVARERRHRATPAEVSLAG